MVEVDPLVIITIMAALVALLVYLRGIVLVRAGLADTGRIWGGTAIALMLLSAWFTDYGAWMFFIGVAAVLGVGLVLAHRR